MNELNGSPFDYSGVVIKAGIWNVGLLPLAQLLSIGASAVIARSLTLQDYAFYAIITSTISATLFYGDLGIRTGAVRFYYEVATLQGNAGLRRFLIQVVLVRLAIFLPLITILVILGPSTARVMKWSQEQHQILPWILPIILLEVLTAPFQGVLAAAFEQRLLNLLSLGQAFLRPLLIITFVGIGWGVSGIIAAILLSSLVHVTMSVYLSLRLRWGTVQNSRPVENLFRRLIKLSLASYLEKMTAYTYRGPAVILLSGFILPPAQVALLAISFQIAEAAVSLGNAPFTNLLVPLFSRLVGSESHPGEKQRAFTWVCMAHIGVFFPAGTTALAVVPWLLPTLFGAKFAPAVSGTEVLLLFAFLEYSLYGPANALLLAGENLPWYISARVPFLAAFPLFLATLNSFGWAAGVGCVGVLRLSMAVVLSLFATRAHRLQFPLLFFGKMVLVGGIIVVMNTLVPAPPALKAIWTPVLFFACAFLIKAFTETELQTLKRHLRAGLVP